MTRNMQLPTTSAYVPAAEIEGSSNGKRRRAADGANWIMGEMGRARIGCGGRFGWKLEVRNGSM